MPRLICGMWDVYWVGVFLGLGVGIGVLLAGLFGSARWGLVAGAVLGAVIGAALGFFFADVEDAIAGALGGLLGAVGASQLVSGTLRRGGTRTATAALLGLAGLVLGALAFVPVLGFAEAAAVPVIGARMRRREPARYAGLRTLARD
jgi:hypothetical protein